MDKKLSVLRDYFVCATCLYSSFHPISNEDFQINVLQFIVLTYFDTVFFITSTIFTTKETPRQVKIIYFASIKKHKLVMYKTIYNSIPSSQEAPSLVVLEPVKGRPFPQRAEPVSCEPVGASLLLDPQYRPLVGNVPEKQLLPVQEVDRPFGCHTGQQEGVRIF